MRLQLTHKLHLLHSDKAARLSNHLLMKGSETHQLRISRYGSDIVSQMDKIVKIEGSHWPKRDMYHLHSVLSLAYSRYSRIGAGISQH